MHHVPIADHGSALRLGARARAQELARARSRGRRQRRLPADASLAEQGLGLVYALEPMVIEQLRTRRLKVVLERYAPTVPGFFLYFPSIARRSAPLRLFVEAAKELAMRAVR